mmetsp:Transcript_17844/g.21396  ORF Transcript_17844/g.21396 Transcript_17844/m.21396 type:complete len:587 (+) Transcript_17844:156-1916(+)|eukprot:CAMPEP_0197849004 /NCGR_PEP_ID=MMETSP1438-20131217/10589_1 /TAXON_ID=1461541 /ORGANISM="Pterosperma sp., Strain CCMP1384" /LENGTH=586 /DNA_ID=CAMNT_0043461499 /DNA_START=138 /DNA_END=1898 /DNA_ORIENTATION=-
MYNQYEECSSCTEGLPGVGTTLEDSVYNYDHRPRRDTAWAFLYLIYLASCVGAGFYSYSHRNLNYAMYTEDYLNDGGHCNASDNANGILQASALDSDVDLGPHYWKRASVMFLISLGGSVVLGLLALHLISKHAMVFMKAAIFFSVTSWLAAAGVVYQYNSMMALIYIGMALLSAFVYYLWRNEIQLVAKLLSVSAVGIRENKSLVPIAVGVKFMAVIFIVPQALGAAFALQNGAVGAAADVIPNSQGKCFDSITDVQTPCCVFQNPGWVNPYMGFTAFGVLWTVMLAFEFRIFTISGSLAQWYFMPASTSTAGTTKRALGHAVGPSFGTLCFGAMVLTWVEIIRSAIRKAQERNDGILTCILAMFASCIMTMLEQITKFGTIMAAITGQAFCDSAGQATELLVRNFLSSYAVWWLPPFMLNFLALCISILWGTCMGIFMYVEEENRGIAGTISGKEAVVTGVVSAIIVGTVLMFLMSIVSDAVDVIYICYAMDRDHQRVTRQQVHAIYVLIPQKNNDNNIGAAVEQPGGDFAYAAPQEVPNYGGNGPQTYAPYPQQYVAQPAGYQYQPVGYQPAVPYTDRATYQG